MIGCHDLVETPATAAVCIGEALDDHFLRGADHQLDMTAGPGVARFNEPFLGVVRPANVVEVHLK